MMMPRRFNAIARCKAPRGFSLVEILIALGIMGLLMTLTVPAILNAANSNLNSKYTAETKDVAFALIAAFEQYKQGHGSISASTSCQDLTPYLNYVKSSTTDTIDWEQGSTNFACGTGGYTCYRLHNGGILHFSPAIAFGGTATTNAIYFYFDPDGQAQSTTNGPGKSILFWLYADGTLKSWGNARTSTNTNYGSIYNACTSCDPPWFTGF